MKTLDPADVASRIAPILRGRGVASASLFGSVAAGTAGPDSDVDVLLECPRGFDLFDLADLKSELEAAVGRKVDFAFEKRLKPRLKEHVLRTLYPVL